MTAGQSLALKSCKRHLAALSDLGSEQPARRKPALVAALTNDDAHVGRAVNYLRLQPLRAPWLRMRGRLGAREISGIRKRV